MKMLLKLSLLTLSLIIVNSAHADYYELSTRYKCGSKYVVASYKYRSLQRARDAQAVLRASARYRNTWIKLIKE